MKSFSKLSSTVKAAADAGTKLAVGATTELGLSPRASTSGVDDLRALFAKIDVDGSGTLNSEAVATLSRELGLQLSVEELDQAMAEMDADGNGEIDFEEFSSWWHGHSPGGQVESSGGGDASPSALRGKFLSAHAKVMDATKTVVDEVGNSSRLSINSAGSKGISAGSKFLTGTVKLATRSVKDVLGSASHQELKQLFDKIDVDGNGSLDRTEVEALCAAMGLAIDAADMDTAMAEMDSDGNGEVDFQEFTTWWGGYHESAGDESSLRSRLLSGTLGEASKSLLGLAGINTEEDEQVAEEAAQVGLTAKGRMVKEVTCLNGLEPSVFARVAALQDSASAAGSSQDATQQLEARLAALHGGEDAVAFPTLAAAVAAVIATGGCGQTIVCAYSEAELLVQGAASCGEDSRDCAGIARDSVRSVLSAVGNQAVHCVDAMSVKAVESSMDQLRADGVSVSALILPAVIQPTQRVPDLGALVQVVKRIYPRCLIVSDNSSLGPYLCRPLLQELTVTAEATGPSISAAATSTSGKSNNVIDVVVEGFHAEDSDCMGTNVGCLILRSDDSTQPGPSGDRSQHPSTDMRGLGERLRRWRKCVGGVMGPHTIALAHASLEASQLHLHHAAMSALEVCKFLELLPCVSRVLCAGLASDASHDQASQLLEAPHCSGASSPVTATRTSYAQQPSWARSPICACLRLYVHACVLH